MTDDTPGRGRPATRESLYLRGIADALDDGGEDLRRLIVMFGHHRRATVLGPDDPCPTCLPVGGSHG